jgi:hypothetical protein
MKSSLPGHRKSFRVEVWQPSPALCPAQTTSVTRSPFPPRLFPCPATRACFFLYLQSFLSWLTPPLQWLLNSNIFLLMAGISSSLRHIWLFSWWPDMCNLSFPQLGISCQVTADPAKLAFMADPLWRELLTH